MSKSFYNLDYIIEINEKRLEEYSSLYQKVSERLTNIILIYSALSIFLVTLVQHLIDRDISNIIYYICFALFLCFILISIIFFIRFILPNEIAFLDPPQKYYKDFKDQLKGINPGDQNKNDDSLKGSYILELETTIINNVKVYRKKSSFHYRALLFALVAVLPYTVCIGYHLSKKEDKIQKVKLIAYENA